MTWSSTTIGRLTRAVGHAPSVHNTQPWTMKIDADSIELYERSDISLPRHDPTGRDRMISCGAALTNLELAIRTLGRHTDVSLFPEPEHPDLVARVNAGNAAQINPTDVERFAAIFERVSYRAPFAPRPITPAHLRTLAAATTEPGTEARVIAETECATLAELFDYAGKVLHDDLAYQRELASWHLGPIGDTLPWGGLVRGDTHLPDTATLTERLLREAILIILTCDDTRRDHLLAGAAVQQVWLASISQGLVASVVTQPLHLREVRASLIERLQLAGYPQIFLRIGHPALAHDASVQRPMPT